MIDLGTCCACGGREKVRNVLMLNKKAPLPGTGWGCTVCGLPTDGAVAVVCDECITAAANEGKSPDKGMGDVPLKEACYGPPGEGKRVSIKSLSGTHEHILSLHRERTSGARTKARLN